MYQPSATNFMGRDPMQWWIGQVTDPVKGEWGDALEKTRDADPDKKIFIHIDVVFVLLDIMDVRTIYQTKIYH